MELRNGYNDAPRHSELASYLSSVLPPSLGTSHAARCSPPVSTSTQPTPRRNPTIHRLLFSFHHLPPRAPPFSRQKYVQVTTCKSRSPPDPHPRLSRSRLPLSLYSQQNSLNAISTSYCGNSTTAQNIMTTSARIPQHPPHGLRRRERESEREPTNPNRERSGSVLRQWHTAA